jgi:hypothetical protein
MPESSERGEPPYCVALILCDTVLEDQRTSNKSLIGLFNQITAPVLPALHGQLFLVASLTSGRGTWEFSLQMTAPSGKTLFSMRDTIPFDDPHAVHDIVVEVRNLTFEEEGVHFVDLFIGSRPLANRRFTVTRSR